LLLFLWEAGNWTQAPEFRTYNRVLIKTCSSPKIMQDKMRGLNFFFKSYLTSKGCSRSWGECMCSLLFLSDIPCLSLHFHHTNYSLCIHLDIISIPSAHLTQYFSNDIFPYIQKDLLNIKTNRKIRNWRLLAYPTLGMGSLMIPAGSWTLQTHTGQ
jgi:hypothetical protein